MMSIITGFTNFALVPGLVIPWKLGQPFQFWTGFFTFFTSFMYHYLESIDSKFYMDNGRWHWLDNIGSIMQFIILAITLMDNLDRKPDGSYASVHFSRTDLHLGMIGFIITLIMQFKHPWRLENTLIPILIFFAIMGIKNTFIRRPRIDWYYFNRGFSFMSIAAVFFVLGLDENKDYLRFYHGMWHCFVGISSVYLRQMIPKDQYEKGVDHYDTQQRYGFWECFRECFGLNLVFGRRDKVNQE